MPEGGRFRIRQLLSYLPTAGKLREYGERRLSAEAESTVLSHHEELGHVVGRDLSHKSEARPVVIDLEEERVTAGVSPIVIEVGISVVTVRAHVCMVKLGEVVSVELNEASQDRSVGALGLNKGERHAPYHSASAWTDAIPDRRAAREVRRWRGPAMRSSASVKDSVSHSDAL